MANIFNTRNDPLVSAVQNSLQEGNLRRQAIEIVNESYGVYNRKAVVREDLAAYDADIETVFNELKEETQLDEISRKKLANYMLASQGDSEDYGDDANDLRSKSAASFKKSRNRKLSKRTRDKYYNDAERLEKASTYSDRKSRNRQAGFERALGKLTRSKPVKYKQPYNPIAVRVLAKEEKYTSGEEAFKSPLSRREAKYTYKEKSNYKEPEKDVYGVIGSKAREKVMAATKKRSLKEESQLDEISKNLARRYKNKAHADYNYTSGQRDNDDFYDKHGKDMKDVFGRPKFKERTKETRKKDDTRIQKRLKGLSMAHKRLSENQLDELSSFGSAFAAARKSGLSTFNYNGKSFNTKLATDSAKAAATKPSGVPVTPTRPSVPTPPSRPASISDVGEKGVLSGKTVSLDRPVTNHVDSNAGLPKGGAIAATTPSQSASEPTNPKPNHQLGAPDIGKQNSTRNFLDKQLKEGLNEGVLVGGKRYKL
jgi:hypothetical protein